MRIRKCASKLLGSAYAAAAAAAPGELAPPPPPSAGYEGCCGAGSSGAAAGVVCELNRSPWDLIAELDLSNPQEDVADKYFARIASRPSWVFSGAAVKSEEEVVAPAVAEENVGRLHEVPKKAARKGKDSDRKAKATKEEAGDGGDKAADQGWTCKKNDGKRWHCRRPTSRPNSLCDYHLAQSRSYYNPNYESPSPAVALAVSASSRARKKKADDEVGEDFYYYAGFGPFRAKRRCRSNLQRYEPASNSNQETTQADDVPEARHDVEKSQAHNDDESCDIAGIAGGDEESDDDDYVALVSTGNGDLRAGDGDGDGSGKRAVETSRPKKGRKPVKARSLKSLL